MIEFFELRHGGGKPLGDLSQLIAFPCAVIAQTEFGVGTAFDLHFFGFFFFLCRRPGFIGFIDGLDRFPPGFADGLQFFREIIGFFLFCFLWGFLLAFAGAARTGGFPGAGRFRRFRGFLRLFVGSALSNGFRFFFFFLCLFFLFFVLKPADIEGQAKGALRKGFSL